MRILIVATCLWSTVALASPDPTVDPRHTAAIRDAASKFTAWKRVDEKPNLAPFLCRAPTPADYGAPSQVRLSAAHGQKLYYLWASHRAEYLQPDGAIPVGFAIVKESFAAVPFKAGTPDPHAAEVHKYVAPPSPITSMITSDGKPLSIGERKDLFVMVKVGDAPGSDAGWIYGTVTPDGRVTSAGRVASCMGCHVASAKRERLFGLLPAPRPASAE